MQSLSSYRLMISYTFTDITAKLDRLSNANVNHAELQRTGHELFNTSIDL